MWTDDLIKTVRQSFSEIKDYRAHNCTYPLADTLMGAFSVFHLKDPSLLAYREQFACREQNLQQVYGIQNIPEDSGLRKCLDKLDPALLRPTFHTLLGQLRQGKILDQVRDVPFELVIVTAYRDFSFRAINEERRPNFFIHKPFDFDTVKEAVRRVEENLLRKASIGVQGQTFSTIPGKLGLPSAEGTEYVPLARVILLEAFGNLTKIWLWLETKPRTVSRHLGWFEKQLPCDVGSPFFRTHSSFIANRDYVRLFRHEGKKAVLMMENNLSVWVSEDRKAGVVE
jgi:DNA-binding LytR/AlgR family response regulator